MKRIGPKPKRLRGYISVVDERKALIMDVLRKSLIPLNRHEITAALGWPSNILANNINKSTDPLVLLIAEGKVGRIQRQHEYLYYADPDISKLITQR